MNRKIRGSLFSHVLSALVIITFSTMVTGQRERDTYSTGSASSFEVSGRVRLAESGLPGNKFAVRLERFGGGIVDQIDTDSGGRFRFPNLPRGYYRVIVNMPGYRSMQQDADLQVVARAFLIFDIVADVSNAMTFIDVIDAKAPPTAREELTRGRAAFAKDDYREAIDHLQKAVNFYPDFYSAQLLLGTAFLNVRDWDQAEPAFKKAVTLKPESSDAILYLGEIYWRQKRYDEAEKILLKGLELDSKSWHGYFTIARLYWDEGKIEKAAPAIGHTLQLKPDFAEGHLLAGNILLKVNQLERARAEYEEYLRLEPKGEFATQAVELVQKLDHAISDNKKSPN